MNRKAFVVLTGSMFISMLGMGIVAPFIPIYANTLGASSLEIGLVQSAFSVTAIGTATLMAFMPLFADLRLGLSTSLIGIMLAARTPISVVQYYTGRLADRWNRRPMVIWSGLAAVIAVALMPLTSGFWTVLIAYTCVALVQAFGMPAANAYIVNEGRTYGMGICIYSVARHNTKVKRVR